MKNLYEILGIPKKATSAQIKKAYYKLAGIYHPDKNKGQDSQEFININFAYTVLMDKKKRKQYDETGQIDTQIISIMGLSIQ